MTRRKIPKLQAGGIPWATQVQLAIDAYKSTYAEKGWASFRAVGRQYNVAWSTVRDRIQEGARRESFGRKFNND